MQQLGSNPGKVRVHAYACVCACLLSTTRRRVVLESKPRGMEFSCQTVLPLYVVLQLGRSTKRVLPPVMGPLNDLFLVRNSPPPTSVADAVSAAGNGPTVPSARQQRQLVVHPNGNSGHHDHAPQSFGRQQDQALAERPAKQRADYGYSNNTCRNGDGNTGSRRPSWQSDQSSTTVFGLADLDDALIHGEVPKAVHRHRRHSNRNRSQHSQAQDTQQEQMPPPPPGLELGQRCAIFIMLVKSKRKAPRLKPGMVEQCCPHLLMLFSCLGMTSGNVAWSLRWTGSFATKNGA